MDKWYYKELEPIIKEFNNEKQELQEAYGANIIDKQFETLKQAEKKSKIKKLFVIEKSEYKNHIKLNI